MINKQPIASRRPSIVMYIVKQVLKFTYKVLSNKKKSMITYTSLYDMSLCKFSE